MSIVYFAGAIVLILAVFLVYKHRLSNKLYNHIENATERSSFKPSFFEIYDKSTQTACNRLIIVQPFDWLILARNGSVYVITDLQYECPIGSCTAVKLHRDQSLFKYVCLNETSTNIIDIFKSTSRLIIKEPYDIKELQSVKDRFNVLDCINYLLEKGYVQIMDEREYKGRSKRSKRSTDSRSIDYKSIDSKSTDSRSADSTKTLKDNGDVGSAAKSPAKAPEMKPPPGSKLPMWRQSKNPYGIVSEPVHPFYGRNWLRHSKINVQENLDAGGLIDPNDESLRRELTRIQAVRGANFKPVPWGSRPYGCEFILKGTIDPETNEPFKETGWVPMKNKDGTLMVTECKGSIQGDAYIERLKRLESRRTYVKVADYE